MTKSEYMKKLSYSLRRLPKEDFNQAIDYFEDTLQRRERRMNSRRSKILDRRKMRQKN